MNNYELADSGQRTVFESGAQRDMSEGKGRYDLISPIAMTKLADCLSLEKNFDLLFETSPNRLVGSAIGNIFSYIEGLREGDEWHIDQLNYAFYLIMWALHNEKQTGGIDVERYSEGGFQYISPEATRRLALVLEKGCKKYSARNWEKGMPVWKYLDSGLRHLFKYLEGMKDEDHLGQGYWNLMAAIHTSEMVNRGRLPAELAEMPNMLPAAKKEGLADIIKGTP